MHQRLLALVALSAALGSGAVAQSTRLPAGQVCDMSARVISLRVVDAAARGVGGATVTLRRVGTRDTRPAAAMGDGGDYLLLEDGQLQDVRPAGEPFEVTVTRGGRVVRRRLVIGLDAGRCHLELKRGSLVVRL